MNAPTPALVARPERLRLVGQRRQILAVMHQRLMIGMLIYGGIIALIILRLCYLAAFGDHAGRKGGALDLAPERGDIVDRNGQALAVTIDAWTIGLQPARVIGNKLDLAQKLAELMPEKDAADYLAMLRSDRNFFYLRRRAAPALVDAINELGEPGLALSREPDRLYPQTTLGANATAHGAVFFRLVRRADGDVAETDQTLNLGHFGVGGHDRGAGGAQGGDRLNHLGLGFGAHDGRQVRIATGLDHRRDHVRGLGDGVVHSLFSGEQIVRDNLEKFDFFHALKSPHQESG